MIVSSGGKKPDVHASAYVAPTAVVSGDVTVGSGCAIMHGAVIVSEGAPVRIGSDCVVMEHAVLRASGGAAMQFALELGDRCLVGPQAYIAGASLGEGCFVAGTARILNGAVLEDDCSVASGTTVHAGTHLTEGSSAGADAERFEAQLFEHVFNEKPEGDVRGRVAETYAKFLRKSHARDGVANETKAPKTPVRRSGEEPPATQTTEVDKVVDVMMLELEEMEHRRQEAIRRQRGR